MLRRKKGEGKFPEQPCAKRMGRPAKLNLTR
jgi:hypothetical protein